MIKRPWAGFGIGWLFAVAAGLIAFLVLVHAFAGTTFLVWICILLLALALLL